MTRSYVTELRHFLTFNLQCGTASFPKPSLNRVIRSPDRTQADMECESDTADGWIESWVSRPSSLQSARSTAITGVLILLVALIQPPGRASTRWATVAPVCAAVAARLWLHISSHYVPEPYLDEIFHIPQAQKYCQGRYDEWDDKLTTPPGL